MRRAMMLVLVTASAAGAAGCKTPTEIEEDAIILTAEPSPAVATTLRGLFYTVKGDDTHPDETREFDWKTTFTVTAHDNRGIDGLKITGVDVKVAPASGGIIFNPRSDLVYSDFSIHASTNQIPKDGSANVAIEAWYDLPNAGRESLVTVAMSFVDKDGFTYSDSIEVNVK